jgi:hypothetical protein
MTEQYNYFKIHADVFSDWLDDLPTDMLFDNRISVLEEFLNLFYPKLSFTLTETNMYWSDVTPNGRQKTVIRDIVMSPNTFEIVSHRYDYLEPNENPISKTPQHYCELDDWAVKLGKYMRTFGQKVPIGNVKYKMKTLMGAGYAG